jgi:hypothetical protein
MGLAEADATLTIALEGGKEHVFAVGEEGYGHRNFYIRDRETGTVYLVSAGVIRPLKFGDARLPERRLVGMQREEIERVRVSRGGEQATFVQKNRDDAAKAFWSRQGSESRAPMATSWMSKILRMTASSYVSKDEMPKDPEKVFALEFVGEGDEATKVTFLRSENESGQAQWYARSGFTRGTVELYRRLGQEAADDLSAVLEEGR